MNKFTDFGKGFIFGFLTAIIFSGFAVWLIYLNMRNKEFINYAKRQIEIEKIREDYINIDPVDFYEIPDVRRAADGATAEFERKRDEALQRFRNK